VPEVAEKSARHALQRQGSRVDDLKYSRIDQADQLIKDALVALSRANHLLGFSEGKVVR
jgi:hypothetical protein